MTVNSKTLRKREKTRINLNKNEKLNKMRERLVIFLKVSEIRIIINIDSVSVNKLLCDYLNGSIYAAKRIMHTKEKFYLCV